METRVRPPEFDRRGRRKHKVRTPYRASGSDTRKGEQAWVLTALSGAPNSVGVAADVPVDWGQRRAAEAPPRVASRSRCTPAQRGRAFRLGRRQITMEISLIALTEQPLAVVATRRGSVGIHHQNSEQSSIL